MKSRIFPNGFIFTDRDINKVKLPSYYKTELITNNFIYSYDKFSNKIIFKEKDRFIIIHGLFTHIDLKEGDLSQKVYTNSPFGIIN